jgi:hypothetical protein
MTPHSLISANCQDLVQVLSSSPQSWSIDAQAVDFPSPLLGPSKLFFAIITLSSYPKIHGDLNKQ